MFVANCLGDAIEHLSYVYARRLGLPVKMGPLQGLPPMTTPPLELVRDAVVIRGAVGLFLVRDDGANGSKLANEVVSSFRYWDARTSSHFDGLFLGWGFDGAPSYNNDGFHVCVSELEKELDWHYGGGAELFLVDFVFNPSDSQGRLDFSCAVPLNITKLLDERKYNQLAPLIEEILRPLSNSRKSDSESPTWKTSDYLGAIRTRRFVWQELVKKVGLLLGWVDDVSNFATRDLRRIK